MANHDEKEFLWNGKIFNLKGGQFVTGRNRIALETGINRSKIERVLKCFESEHQIEQQMTTKYRLITILNWEKYQKVSNDLPTKRATSEQQVSTIKNLKNDKKEEEDIAANAATPLKEPLKEELMTLESYVASMRSSPQRYIRIIGEWADELKPSFTTKAQWKVFTGRNVRVAKQIEPFTDEQMANAMATIQKNTRSPNNPRGFITEATLETLLKYLLK